MSFSLSYLLTFDRQLIPQISLIIGLESSGSVALSFSFFTEQLNKPYFIPINIPIEAQLLVKLELWFRGIFSTSIFNLPLSNKPQRQAESHQQRSNQISILFGKNTLARVLKLGVSPSCFGSQSDISLRAGRVSNMLSCPFHDNYFNLWLAVHIGEKLVHRHKNALLHFCPEHISSLQ